MLQLHIRILNALLILLKLECYFRNILYFACVFFFSYSSEEKRIKKHSLAQETFYCIDDRLYDFNLFHGIASQYFCFISLLFHFWLANGTLYILQHTASEFSFSGFYSDFPCCFERLHKISIFINESTSIHKLTPRFLEREIEIFVNQCGKGS